MVGAFGHCVATGFRAPKRDEGNAGDGRPRTLRLPFPSVPIRSAWFRSGRALRAYGLLQNAWVLPVLRCLIMEAFFGWPDNSLRSISPFPGPISPFPGPIRLFPGPISPFPGPGPRPCGLLPSLSWARLPLAPAPMVASRTLPDVSIARSPCPGPCCPWPPSPWLPPSPSPSLCRCPCGPLPALPCGRLHSLFWARLALAPVPNGRPPTFRVAPAWGRLFSPP